MQTYRIDKITFDAEPSTNQMLKVEYRKASDPDEASSYTTVSSNASVATDGTFVSPVYIDDLDRDTDYVIKYTNLLGGTPFTETIHSTIPVVVGSFLDKVANGMPNMQYIDTSDNTSGLLDSYLPEKVGCLYSFSSTFGDILEDFGNAQYTLVDNNTGISFEKRLNELGIKVTTNVASLISDPSDDTGNNEASILGPDGTRDYSMGIWVNFDDTEFAQTGVDGKLWLIYIGDPNQHIGIYIDTTTKYVHWIHKNASTTEEIICDHAVVANQWIRIFVRRSGSTPDDSYSNQILIAIDGNEYAPTTATYFTSATNYAGRNTQPIYIGMGKQDSNSNIVQTLGVFKYFYFRGSETDNNLRERVLNPPYPKVVITDTDGSNEFDITFEHFVKCTNSQASFVFPADTPTGSKNMFYRTYSNDRSPVSINIIPFAKRSTDLDIDFSDTDSYEDNRQAVADNFYALHKAWGGYANGGVITENIYFQDGNLVLECHGDSYDGNVTGVNKDSTDKTHTIQDDPDWGTDPKYGQAWTTRTGCCLVSKDYLGFGEFKIRCKIPELLGVAPAWWVFHYEEVYQNTPEYEDLLAEGLKKEGTFADGYYLVRNHEIDIEQPSHLAMGVFNGWTEVATSVLFFNLNANYNIGIQNDTTENNGLWRYVGATFSSDRTDTSVYTITDGTSLTKIGSPNNYSTARTGLTMKPNTGQKYFEIKWVSGTGTLFIGVSETTQDPTTPVGNAGWSINSVSRKFAHQSGGGTTWGGGNNTFAVGDVIGILIDTDTGSFTAYKNGVSMGSAYGSGYITSEVEVMVCMDTPDMQVGGYFETFNVLYPVTGSLALAKGIENTQTYWTKVSDTVDPIYNPNFGNFKCNTWIGETGSGNGWRYKDSSIPDTESGDVYLANLTPIGQMANDGNFHDYEWHWYKDRVEFYFDGVKKQTSKAFIPDIPSRLTFGCWFPSGTSSNGSVAPWLPDPTKTWAGSPANWNYQKMIVQQIKYTNYTDDIAGGSNREIGESYPFDGMKDFSLNS